MTDDLTAHQVVIRDALDDLGTATTPELLDAVPACRRTLISALERLEERGDVECVGTIEQPGRGRNPTAYTTTNQHRDPDTDMSHTELKRRVITTMAEGHYLGTSPAFKTKRIADRLSIDNTQRVRAAIMDLVDQGTIERIGERSINYYRLAPPADVNPFWGDDA